MLDRDFYLKEYNQEDLREMREHQRDWTKIGKRDWKKNPQRKNLRELQEEEKTLD